MICQGADSGVEQSPRSSILVNQLLLGCAYPVPCLQVKYGELLIRVLHCVLDYVVIFASDASMDEEGTAEGGRSMTVATHRWHHLEGTYRVVI